MNRFMSRTLAVSVAFVLAVLPNSIAFGDPVVGGTPGDDAFVIVGEDGSGSGGGSSTEGPASGSGGSLYTAYKWASICQGNPDGSPVLVECSAALSCPAPAERRWQLWGQTPAGQWVPVMTQCMGGPPPEVALPTVTPGDVLSALRRVGLPKLVTHVQPAAKTLVNLDTIFFTESEPVEVNLTILGQAVEVVATPDNYRWNFGDGSSTTTTVPGGPYPAKTITHRYTDARVTVAPNVEVTYSAEFRLNGGAWQDVNGTVTTVGPTTALRVAEATAVLSGAHD